MVQRKSGVKAIPEGLHAVTPHLVVKGGADAIAFYKKAFGAQELHRMPGPDGKLMHAAIKIGDSQIFLADEHPQMGHKSPLGLGGSPVSLHVYVDDVDTVFQKAVAAGAKVRMPVMDMFWGDRYGQVTDPFGHEWSIATHIEDVPPEEMPKRAQAAFSQPGQCK
jgi:uncharacterized glyoxalase superfamily protein PhnB